MLLFPPPCWRRDVTVYAVAGDRGTVLALAKAHKIPIPFDCQDGECGSCLIQVTHLSPHTKYGIALTEKRKRPCASWARSPLRKSVTPRSTTCRPAIGWPASASSRNEDIMVTFEGDQTLPAQGPHLSTAAKIFSGGIKVNDLDTFFGFALSVEEEAAIHFDELAAAMAEVGNEEVAKLFRQLAGYSRLHYEQTKSRAGSRDLSKHVPPSHIWPDQVTPERTELWAGDPNLSRLDALKAALQGERRGYEFYYAVAGTSNNPEVSAQAKEFVKEEAEHVKILEAWIAARNGWRGPMRWSANQPPEDRIVAQASCLWDHPHGRDAYGRRL